MVTTRRQRREEEEKIRREKLWNSISNDIRKRRTSLLNSIAADGITSEIVLRLPVDTLSRFKCASKTWYTLLHERSFIKMHLNRSIRNNTFAFMIFNSSGIYSVDYDISSSRFNKAVQIEPPFNASAWFMVHGSCNGILLITTFYQNNRICLWNPSTREYKDISEQFSKTPKYPRELYEYERIRYWIGYDLSTDDYKVIRIAYHHNFNNGDRICDVHVYSMRTDSCNRIQQDIPYTIYGVVSRDLLHYPAGGILLNGAIHWLGGHGSITSGFLWMIVTFDLAKEDFKDFQLPGDVVSSKSIRLGMIEDCLCIYSVNKDSYIDMFVMKEYGVKESWTKMFSISEQSIAMRDFNPLSITNEGKLLVQLKYKDLALYDPNNGGRRCGNIKIQGLPRRISNFFRIVTYVKSLVSLRTNTCVI